MEALPPEVMVQIAPYLSVKDVAASCAVSVSWRDVFGSDVVWRPRCDEVIAKHLETTLCRVEPKFISPQPEDSSLSPIGRWRMAFMRETHLWCNWISGNYSRENHHLEQPGWVLFLNSDLFVVLNRKTVMLMDTSIDPPLCVAQLNFNISGIDYLTPTVVNSDMIINVNKENIVQVIKVDLENQTMLFSHSFCIDDSLGEVGHYIAHFVVNSVLLGFQERNDNMYVWDLLSGTKLKTEHLPLKFASLSQSRHCDDVVIKGPAVDGLYHYLIYNTIKLTYWPLEVVQKQQHECVIMKDYIAIAIESSLRVYNYKTSQLVYEVPVCLLVASSVHVFKDSLMFIRNNTLQQFFPSSGSMRCIMKSNLISFTPIGEKLIVVATADKQIQIWRIGPVSIFKTLVTLKSPMEINESYSKVILLKTREDLLPMHLLHFW